jgi:hypothetical protein
MVSSSIQHLRLQPAVAASEALRRVGKVESRIPWPGRVFCTLSPHGLATITCVVRATYTFSGRRLTPSRAPTPIRFADEYFGDPSKASLRAPSDMVPFKPRGDIILVDPIARSPGAAPRRSWDFRIAVGQHSVDGVVAPPALRGSRIAPTPHRRIDPIAVRRLALIYENLPFDAAENPVGTRERGRHATAWAVPGIPLHAMERRPAHRPVGLAPIHPAWEQRRRLAGTYDEDWRRDQWPLLPRDFDYEFFNAAPPALRSATHFRGDEPVTIVGFRSEGPCHFSLPSERGIELRFVGRRPDDRLLAKLHLDTIELDMNTMTVGLIWRAAVDPPPFDATTQIAFTASSQGARHGAS